MNRVAKKVRAERREVNVVLRVEFVGLSMNDLNGGDRADWEKKWWWQGVNLKCSDEEGDPEGISVTCSPSELKYTALRQTRQEKPAGVHTCDTAVHVCTPD